MYKHQFPQYFYTNDEIWFHSSLQHLTLLKFVQVNTHWQTLFPWDYSHPNEFQGLPTSLLISMSFKVWKQYETE